MAIKLTEESELLIKAGGPTVFGKIILGWQPHPAQSKILQSDAKVKVIAAGRRFGKSECMAIETLWFAITKPGTKQFIISASHVQARIIFDKLYEFSAKYPLLAQYIAEIKWTPFPEMRFINGSVVHARSTSYDGKYLRGHSAHRIIIDEAAFLKGEIVDTVIRPMLADYDGYLVLISTPCGRNYFYDEFQKGLKKVPGYECWQFDSLANPHISHSYVEEQRQNLLDIQYRSEWLAEFIDDQITVFRWQSINDALEELQESYEHEEGHVYTVGVDIAKQHDFTSITVLDVTNSKKCFVKYTENFNNKPYAFVVERVLAVSQVFMPIKILVDETGVGAGPTESIINTLPNSEGFTFSMASKISLINTLKLAFEQHRIRLPQNNNKLIEQLRYYQYEMTDSGNLKMHAPSGKFDDMVISLALAFMPASAQWAEPSVHLVDKVKPKELEIKDGLLATEPMPMRIDESIMTVV